MLYSAELFVVFSSVSVGVLWTAVKFGVPDAVAVL